MWERRIHLAGITEAWLGVVWAWLLGEFVATVGFASRQTGELTLPLVLLSLVISPAALAIPAVRAIARRGPLLVAAAAAAPWIEPVTPRAAALGIGFVGVSMALLDAGLTRPRPVADGWIVGIAALLGIRWWAGAGDPSPWVVVAGGVVTVLLGMSLPPEPRTSGSGRLLGGVAFGAATWAVHTWFLGPTVIARWAGFGPGAAGAVLGALGLGFAVAPVIRANAAWLGVVGTTLLIIANGPTSLVGGCVLAFALPSLWSDALVVLARSGPRGIAAAAITHLGLLLLQAGAFANDYQFGGSSYRPSIGWIAVGAAALAAQPGLGRAFGRERGGLEPARFAAPVVAAALAVIRLWPRQPTPPGAVDVAMSWNLRQGFGADGRIHLSEITERIRSEGITVLGLQESDGTRLTSGGRDLVASLADDLGMYSASGPGPHEATFGVALLSSHPILEVEPLVIPSSGDHAVVLLATIDVRGTPLQVAVAHSGGPLDQRPAQSRAVASALAVVEGPLLVLGDLGMPPEAPEFAELLSTGRLQDAPPSGAVLWRGLSLEPARALDPGRASDRPPVVARFTLR